MPGRNFVGILFATLLFVPILFQTAAWHAGFGKLSWYTFTQGDLARPLMSGWSAAIWIHAMAAIPWVVLIVGLGLRQSEPEFEEDALLDVSPFQVFLRVTLLRSAGSMLVAGIWIFVMTAGEITVVNICLVRTLADEIYQPMDGNEQLGLLVGSTMLLVGLTLAASFFVAYKIAPPTREGTLRSPWQLELGRWNLGPMLFVAIVVIVVVAVPMISMIATAGIDTVAIGDEKVQQWSAGKLMKTLMSMPARYGEEFFWTLAIGSIAAVIALLAAAPVAWLACRGGVHSLPALTLAAVCCAVPGPVIGVAILYIRDSTDLLPLVRLFDKSIFAPVIATTIRALPLTILILWYSFRSIGRDQIASASTEGAGTLPLLWEIGLRQKGLTCAIAWLIAFALASGDLSSSILVVPPGIETIPRLVFGKIHSGVDDHAAAICLICVAAFVSVAGATLILIRLSRGAGLDDVRPDGKIASWKSRV